MNPTILVVFVIGTAQLLTATPVHRREIIADYRKQFFTVPEVLTTTIFTPHARMENINKVLETTTILPTDDELSISNEESINKKPGSIAHSSEVQDDSSEIKNGPPETSSPPPESSHSNSEDKTLTLGSTVFTVGELHHPNETTEHILDKSPNKVAEPTVNIKVSSENSETGDLIPSSSQPPYENLGLSSQQVSYFTDVPFSEAFQTTSEVPLQLTEMLFEDNPVSTTLISSSEDSTPSSMDKSDANSSAFVSAVWLSPESQFQTSSPLPETSDSLSLDTLISSESSTDTAFLTTKVSGSPFETSTPIDAHLSSEPLSETTYYTPEASEHLSQNPIASTDISHSSQKLYSEISKISLEIQEPSSEFPNLASDSSSETPHVLNVIKTSDLPVTDIPESSTPAPVTSSEALIPTYLYTNTPSDVFPETSFPLSEISTDITSFSPDISFPLSEVIHSSPEPPSITLNSTSNTEFEASTTLSEDNTQTSTIQNFDPSSEILLTISEDKENSFSNLTLSTEGSNLSSEGPPPSSSTSDNPETYFEDATSSSYIPNPSSNTQFSPSSSVFDSTTETPISLLEALVTSDMPLSSHEDLVSSYDSSSTIYEYSKSSSETSVKPEQSFEDATSLDASSYIPNHLYNTQFSSSSPVFDLTTETPISLLEASVTPDMPISSYEDLVSSYESFSVISEDLKSSIISTSDNPVPSSSEAHLIPSEVPEPFSEATTRPEDATDFIHEGIHSSELTTKIPYPTSETSKPTSGDQSSTTEVTFLESFPSLGFSEPTSETLKTSFSLSKISESTLETLSTSSEIPQTSVVFLTESLFLGSNTSESTMEYTSESTTEYTSESTTEYTSESTTEYSSFPSESLEGSSKTVFSSITLKPPQENSELTISPSTTESSTLLKELSSEISFHTSKTSRLSTEVPETTTNELTDWPKTLAGYTTESSLTEVSQSFETSSELSTLIDIISSLKQTTEDSIIPSMDPVTTTSTTVTNSTDTKGTTAQVTTEPRNSGKLSHNFSLFLPLILFIFISTVNIIT